MLNHPCASRSFQEQREITEREREREGNIYMNLKGTTMYV